MNFECGEDGTVRFGESNADCQPISRPIVERFTAGDDARLHYTLRVEDPEFVTQPFEAKRYWVARPGEEVLPFECKETKLESR